MKRAIPALLAALMLCASPTSAEAFAPEGVYISELMANDDTLHAAPDGSTADWIELCNGGAEPVDIGGWHLTDDPEVPEKWSLPEDTVLEPGACLVIYADKEEGEYHACFKLDKDGETVVLSDRDGTIVSELSYEKAKKDTSVVRRPDGSLYVCEQPTPGRVGLGTAESPTEAPVEAEASDAPAEAPAVTEAPEATSTAELAASDEPVPAADPEGEGFTLTIGEETATAEPDAAETPEPTEEPRAKGLYINEICADSSTGSDWVELRNTSSETIDLSGYGLSDDESEPMRWCFPEGTRIKHGGYLTVQLTGAEGEAKEDGLCAPFALKAEKAQVLLLSDPDWRLLEAVRFEGLTEDISYGRLSGKDEYRYFSQPTRGKKNASDGYLYPRAQAPELSVTGGLYEAPVTLTLTAEEGADIYYTVNGTTPTVKSTRYTAPIELTETTCVRAIACRTHGIPSGSVGATYIIGETHTGYTVCVSGDSVRSLMRNGTKGRYAETLAEIYAADGTQLISQVCELRMHGNTSLRDFAQKSFHLTAKGRYGKKRFDASLFTVRGYEDCNSVVLRCSGQDNKASFMKDALLTGLARHTSVFYQAHELASVYVNGSFWGTYWLRERIDTDTIAQFEGWKDEDAVNLLDGPDAGVKEGSRADWAAMLAFVKGHDLSDDANVEALRSYLDIENYLEYVMLQMFIDNRDLDNVRMYSSAEDPRMHWVLFDTDLSCLDVDRGIGDWLEHSEVGTITKQSTLIFRKLMKNAKVRDSFLTRFGELLRGGFSTESVLSDIDVLHDTLEPEMQAECERWGWSVESWEKSVERLRTFFEQRPGYVRKSLIRSFRLTDEEAERYFGTAEDA